MKTKAICTRLLAPAMICAASVLATASSATQRSNDLPMQSGFAGVSVAETPLILSDFDRSAVLQRAAGNAAENTNLVGNPLTASLVGPERIVLPRAGGTTSVTLAVQGLSLTVRPVGLPSGISVSLSGNQLTVVSTANTGTSERVGTFAITGQGPHDPLSGRLRGVLTVGVSQLPCTATTCSATGTSAPVSIVMAPATKVAGADWSAVAESMRSRNSADVILVVIDGDDTPNRTGGASVTRLAQLCAANGLKCILELSSQAGPAAASNASASAYFLSPDVHAALYGTEAQLILSLRGEMQLDGKLGAINQLRAAGLGHTLLVNRSENASRILAGDSHRGSGPRVRLRFVRRDQGHQQHRDPAERDRLLLTE